MSLNLIKLDTHVVNNHIIHNGYTVDFMEHFDLTLHKIIGYNERLIDLFWFSKLKIRGKHAMDFPPK